MKFLVIDSDETNRRALKKILGTCGAHVSESGEGRHAIAKLERAHDSGEPFDIMLLACHMPVMGGFEVAAQLRNKPGLCGAIIMMSTSDYVQTDIEKARALGINSCLVKPIKYSEFQQALCMAMHRTNESAGVTIPEKNAIIAEIRRPFRILLAEDHEINRMFIQTYLKHTSHHLDVVQNGEIACRKFVEGQFDLVIMDIMMPVMDGYAATRWIRNWEKEQQREPTPIIALTAHTLKEHIQKCLDAGCNACITKPVRKDQLLEIIRTYSGLIDGHSPSVSSKSGKDDEAGVAVLSSEKNQFIVHVDKALKEFIPRFFEVTYEDIASVKKALHNGDYEIIHRIGHGMKGSGTSFGFNTMTHLGKSIEQAAKDGNSNEIRRYLANLIDYIERVEVVFV